MNEELLPSVSRSNYIMLGRLGALGGATIYNSEKRGIITFSV